MSMREYAFDDYGLLLSNNIIKVIASKYFKVDFTEENDEDWGYNLYEAGVCEYTSEFTGDAQFIDNKGQFSWGGDYKSYDNDILVYVPLDKYPTLFTKAYNNLEEVISEFKSKLCAYLPDDFDYRSRICHISGTYYG